MKTREETIDDLILALMYLTRFNDGEGSPFNEIAWKNYDFDAIDRLDRKDLVIDPKNRRGGSYKYAYLTEKGREKAREILGVLDVADTGLYERFDFCPIDKELADEAAEIEQICFPPNEACAPKQMKERIETASDLFLVARDCEKDGKIAGFLNGIATDEYHFKDDFSLMLILTIRTVRISCFLDWMFCRSIAKWDLEENWFITIAEESRSVEEKGLCLPAFQTK